MSEPIVKTLAEWAAEAGEAGNGIRCPKCNCVQWKVYYTRGGNGVIKRSRICRNINCQNRILTYERVAGSR